MKIDLEGATFMVTVFTAFLYLPVSEAVMVIFAMPVPLMVTFPLFLFTVATDGCFDTLLFFIIPYKPPLEGRKG